MAQVSPKVGSPAPRIILRRVGEMASSATRPALCNLTPHCSRSKVRMMPCCWIQCPQCLHQHRKTDHPTRNRHCRGWRARPMAPNIPREPPTCTVHRRMVLRACRTRRRSDPEMKVTSTPQYVLYTYRTQIDHMYAYNCTVSLGKQMVPPGVPNSGLSLGPSNTT